MNKTNSLKGKFLHMDTNYNRNFRFLTDVGVEENVNRSI